MMKEGLRAAFGFGTGLAGHEDQSAAGQQHYAVEYPDDVLMQDDRNDDGIAASPFVDEHQQDDKPRSISVVAAAMPNKGSNDDVIMAEACSNSPATLPSVACTTSNNSSSSSDSMLFLAESFAAPWPSSPIEMSSSATSQSALPAPTSSHAGADLGLFISSSPITSPNAAAAAATSMPVATSPPMTPLDVSFISTKSSNAVSKEIEIPNASKSSGLRTCSNNGERGGETPSLSSTSPQSFGAQSVINPKLSSPGRRFQNWLSSLYSSGNAHNSASSLSASSSPLMARSPSEIAADIAKLNAAGGVIGSSPFPKGILKPAKPLQQQSDVVKSAPINPDELDTLVRIPQPTMRKIHMLGKAASASSMHRTRKIRFDIGVRIESTYGREEYDRSCAEVIAKSMTAEIANMIKRELNEVKQEMPVHEDSKCHTQFYHVR